jgi:outer membrane biogenesis lipoprotein LolB
MPTLIKLTAAMMVTAFLAACAQQAVQQPNFDPPQRRQTDAKTQLESGRRF